MAAPSSPALSEISSTSATSDDLLLKQLTVSSESDSSTATYTLDASTRTAHRRNTHKILGPVVDPHLYTTVNEWLQTRRTSLADLSNGLVFMHALQIPPDSSSNVHVYLEAFNTVAADLGLRKRDQPVLEDLTHNRNLPRVLHALAFVAARVDATVWYALEPPALSATWMEMAMDEQWSGDAFAHRLAKGLPEDCDVVIAGIQGVGKSATIETLLGRIVFPASHALAMPACGEDARLRAMHGAIVARVRAAFPVRLNESMSRRGPGRTVMKVGGRVLSVVELPGMEAVDDGPGEGGARMMAWSGRFDDVLEQCQDVRAGLVIIVARLDAFDAGELGRTVRRVGRLFGKGVLGRMVVVLTHGQAVPPCGMSYEVWAFDVRRRVHEVLVKVGGTGLGGRVEIAVVENSEACQAEMGRRVLPDGTDMLRGVEECVMKVVERVDVARTFEMMAVRQWWETWAMLAGLVLLGLRSRW